MTGGGQAAVAAQLVDGLTVEAGGLTWNQQRAAVASLGYPDKKHFAGLLGAPILMRYTVRFVFEARTVQLIDPATYKPPASAVLVPFELQENLPLVRATLDTGSGAIEARLMVDTGASQFLDLNGRSSMPDRLVETMTDATARIGGRARWLGALPLRDRPPRDARRPRL